MVSTFRIVLRQDEGYDAHQTREFDLELDSKFAVGRASKNISKGYLLPAKNNVYIDSPVVSREHAILTANATSGTPQVYITDTKSMHGTQVNGTQLVPHTPKQLFNNDKLQFGAHISRNESTFVAFKYTFHAELSDPEPFSRGFTVPEAESEDEELGFAQAGRGSQLDPLILDDSDADSEHEEHKDYVEHSEDNADVTLAQLDEDEEEEETPEIDTSSLMDEDEEDEKDSGSSVADYLDDSDAASTGSALDYSPESPLVPEAQYVEEDVDVSSIVQNQPSATEPMLLDADSVRHMHVSELMSPPAWPEVNDHVTFPSSMFDSTIAPPLPPRPSQKRQRIWDEPLQEEQGLMSGAPSELPSLAPFGGLTQEYRAPPFEDMFAFLPAADRIQTPPPTVPAEVVTVTPPHSTLSTDVLVPEIVDEQPPTPTSIDSRKRSADDAFEEETEDLHDPEAMDLEVEVAAPEITVPTVEQVAPQPQRPIAQPKSIFRRALHAAKLMVPATALGAVFTVGALTALPESFFTVA